MKLLRLKGLTLGLIIFPLLAACSEDSNDRLTTGVAGTKRVEEFTVKKRV